MAPFTHTSTCDAHPIFWDAEIWNLDCHVVKAGWNTPNKCFGLVHAHGATISGLFSSLPTRYQTAQRQFSQANDSRANVSLHLTWTWSTRRLVSGSPSPHDPLLSIYSKNRPIAELCGKIVRETLGTRPGTPIMAHIQDTTARCLDEPLEVSTVVVTMDMDLVTLKGALSTLTRGYGQKCSPTTSAMDAVKRIMAYLKGAKDWCLGVPLTSPNGGVSTGSDSMGVVSSLADAQAKGAKAICHHSSGGWLYVMIVQKVGHGNSFATPTSPAIPKSKTE